MDLDHAACYRIIQARDVRYDGRLYTGVRTTGIYCRPICPARTPRPENVLFYPSAAAAQAAGFRPCLRCRPEVAPELAAWNGTASTVTRALRLMETTAGEALDLETLAARLGVGTRQLRRLFSTHVGAPPGAVLRTRRLHLARQLLRETDLPIGDVAHASGFGSVRRFNEVFSDLYGRPPASLRRTHRATAGAPVPGLTIRLAYTPPYAWDDILSFLARRAIPGVELVADDSYIRSVALGGQQGVLAVGHERGALVLRLHGRLLDVLPTVIRRVRGMFDLGADPRAIDTHLSLDPLLSPLVRARPGLRIAGAWDGFELAVRAVLGQQITVAAARGLAGRLADGCGEPLDPSLAAPYPGLHRLFPVPALVTETIVSALRMPRQRSRALAALARTVQHQPRVLDQHPSLDASIHTLRQVPGVGDWTAHYIAMRQLREPDAFPAADAGLLRAYSLLTGTHDVTSAALAAHAERWRPWRAYGAAHLWASLTTRAADAAFTQVA